VVSSIITKLLYALLSLFIVLNVGLLLNGVTRKLYARVSKRYGIRFYQPYIDLVKNYSLETLVSHGVMFYLGPIFRLTSGVGMILFIPFQEMLFSCSILCFSEPWVWPWVPARVGNHILQ